MSGAPEFATGITLICFASSTRVAYSRISISVDAIETSGPALPNTPCVPYHTARRHSSPAYAPVTSQPYERLDR